MGSTSHTNDELGVYVHIPFCSRRCGYCAFATWSDRSELIEAYLAAVRTDIERAVAGGMGPASTIFVGGGTPSLVPAQQLADVISGVPVGQPAEVTVECNPDQVTAELLGTYRSAGVNRVSLGVQSLEPAVLAALDRQHDQAAVLDAIGLVASAGFDSYSVDLIFGVAGESVASWEATVNRVLDLGVPHLSAYALTVEPGTPLASMPERFPDDDDQAEKYAIVDDACRRAGLVNYEISNWARPGHECRHNLGYWRQGNYVGFGCAAHSHVDGRRWWNVRTPERYIAAVTAGRSTEAASETIDADGRALERLELAVRTREGVPLDSLDGDELAGLVEPLGDRWVLTQRGRLLANEVAVRLRPPGAIG